MVATANELVDGNMGAGRSVFLLLMNRLLLDTSTIVWWADGSAELGAAARKRIQDAEAVYGSAASEWELSIKAALSKTVLRRSIVEATMAGRFRDASTLVSTRSAGA